MITMPLCHLGKLSKYILLKFPVIHCHMQSMFRRTYDDPSLVDAERYRVDPYQQPRRPRHGSEYGYEAPVQRSHSRSSIHSAYDER